MNLKKLASILMLTALTSGAMVVTEASSFAKTRSAVPHSTASVRKHAKRKHARKTATAKKARKRKAKPMPIPAPGSVPAPIQK